MRSIPVIAITATAFLSSAVPLLAQDRSVSFGLGFGASVQSAYPGSDEVELEGDFDFAFGNLTWGRTNIGNGIGVIPGNGLSFGGAFRVIGSRDPEDNPELAGLIDIDTAVELGLRLIYHQTNWLAFGEVRQGFGGHDGVSGTLGADAILRPSERWTLTAGPRVNLGNSEYATTYFGVTGAEAAASNFREFDSKGGVLGAGLQIGATYQINDNWSAKGLLSYEKLLGDAVDSPITSAGSEDQMKLRIGLSRAFTLRF